MIMKTKTPALPSWKTSLIPLLFPEHLPPMSDLPRIAIVGIGDLERGDEAAGVLVARALQTRKYAADAGRILVTEAGHAPANLAGELRRFQPQVVILIDALQMDLPAGEIAWLPWETSTGLSPRSSNMALSMMARYLMLEFGCTVHLLGIQPAQAEGETSLSLAAQAAVDELIQTFCRLLFCH
jgi:hydrogenase 3 maturation protease